MNQRDVKRLAHGLYRVFWKGGGTSLAAVGSNYLGGRWLAPTNWITVSSDYGISPWHKVDRVELVKCEETKR